MSCCNLLVPVFQMSFKSHSIWISLVQVQYSTQHLISNNLRSEVIIATKRKMSHGKLCRYWLKIIASSLRLIGQVSNPCITMDNIAKPDCCNTNCFVLLMYNLKPYDKHNYLWSAFFMSIFNYFMGMFALCEILMIFRINHLLLQASGSDGLFQHVVYINADQYTVTNNQSIPTGNTKAHTWSTLRVFNQLFRYDRVSPHITLSISWNNMVMYVTKSHTASWNLAVESINKTSKCVVCHILYKHIQ